MKKSIYCKIFIYIHKDLFVPQAPDPLEKLAESLIYNVYLPIHLAKNWR